MVLMNIEVDEKDVCKNCKHLKTNHQKGFNIVDVKMQFTECQVIKIIDGIEWRCNCKHFIPLKNG